MSIKKLSISLPEAQCDFINQYQSEHDCASRSEVINLALQLLQQRILAAQYREADEEHLQISKEFDPALLDGLDADETW